MRDIGAVDPDTKAFIAPTLAARVDLFFQTGIRGLFQAQGSAQMLLNTSGKEFFYAIPESILPTVKSIQARRQNIPFDSVVLPPLPAIQGITSVNVPAALPNVLPGEDNQPGPYFSLMLGDVSEAPGETRDTNDNGLVNASLTIANAVKLPGAASIAVSTDNFSLAFRSKASLALPGAANLFNATSTGTLLINSKGLVGSFTIDTSLNIPGVNLRASFASVIGINTTAESVFVSTIPTAFNQTLAPRSAMILVQGTLNTGGLEIKGKFGISVSGESIQMMVDAGIDVFDLANLRVSGAAAIYYGANPGLTLDAAIGTGLRFGPKNFTFLDIGANLNLSIDSRRTAQRFEISLTNALINLASVLQVTGSGKIAYNQGVLRVLGSFSGSILDIVTVDASGFFDTEGNFELYLNSRFQLGNDDWGIRAGGTFHILRDTTRTTPVYLAFSAELFAEVRAFGGTLLGARLGVSYNSPPAGDGRIRVSARVDIVFVPVTINFTLGYFRLDGPPLPRLADLNNLNDILTLNVGNRRTLRSDDASPDEIDETYTVESIGKGSNRGERVRVSAFGTSQIFDNVTSVSGDFGEGDDQLILADGFGSFTPAGTMTVTVWGGTGNDLLINQSMAQATLRGGDGHDTLISNGTADSLFGDAGDDTLSSQSRALLYGGDGDDLLSWQSASGLPALLDGGAGQDRLNVYGYDGIDRPDAFVLSGNTSGLLLSGDNGVTNVLARSVEMVGIFGRGGADTLTINSAGVIAANVALIEADLNRIQGQETTTQDGTVTAPLIDDGMPDRATLFGTTGADSITVTAEPSKVTANVSNQLTFVLQSPNSRRDSVVIDAGDGNDTLSISLQAAWIVPMTLLSGAGDDIVTLPFTNLMYDGGTGANSVTLIPDTDERVSLTSTKATDPTGSLTYSNAGKLTIGAGGPAELTLQSTTSEGVTVNLGGNSFLTVNGTNGPVLAKVSGGLAVNNTGSTLDAEINGGATISNMGPFRTSLLMSGTRPVIVNGNRGLVDIALAQGNQNLVYVNETNAPVNIAPAAGSTSNNGTVYIGQDLLSRCVARSPFPGRVLSGLAILRTVRANRSSYRMMGYGSRAGFAPVPDQWGETVQHDHRPGRR